MNVYLAAPFSLKDQCTQEAEELRAAGVTVTSRWLDEPYKPSTQLHEVSDEEKRFYASRDVEDIFMSDVLVFHVDETKSIVRAGRHVEFGIAIGLCIPIMVVGNTRENIFHHLPGVHHFSSWGTVREILFGIEDALRD